MTAVATAYWARTPLVVVTPELGNFATGHAPIFSKITRWQAQVSSPLHVADLMHRAFTIALHERGPVQVSLSDECFRGESDYEIRAPLAIERAAGGTGFVSAATRPASFSSATRTACCSAPTR